MNLTEAQSTPGYFRIFVGAPSAANNAPDREEFTAEAAPANNNPARSAPLRESNSLKTIVELKLCTRPFQSYS